MLEVVVMVVTDGRGRVVMQHRSDDAPTSPGKWSVPGGGVDPGETPEQAAHRELLEETGLVVPDLHPRRAYERTTTHGLPVRIHVYAGTTDATDDELICGEGQAMIFLPLEEAWRKDLTRVARENLPPAMPATPATTPARPGTPTTHGPAGEVTVESERPCRG